MLVFPAIDLMNGKCVRLVQGSKHNETVYGNDPLLFAQRWINDGAKRLHIVDLDGAFGDTMDNFAIVHKIIRSIDVPVQFGGGIRSLEKLKVVFAMGVSRAILGTMAIEDHDFVEKAISMYGDKIVIGIDARYGKVATKGWVTDSNIDAFDLALRMQDIGAKTIVYTDILRDGMLAGPNFESISNLINNTTLDVIASGGVSSVNDIEKLKKLRVSGVIVGKALYDGSLKLNDLMMLEV